MILGIFLSTGESFRLMSKSGQDERFKKSYLPFFSASFNKIFIFSYANEKVSGLPKNIVVVPNKYQIPRLAYGILMPFINYKVIKKCDGFRAYHLVGCVPGIVSKLVFNKPYIFNYAYDYIEFAKVENMWFQWALIKIISPIVNKTASKIFECSGSVHKYVPKEKSVILPNGVDTKLFKPAKTSKKSKELKLLTIGRLEKQKNHLNLIRAIAGMNAKLTIIGNGSLKNELELAAKEFRAKVSFVEIVENRKLPLFYNDADIFILPSLTEGSSKVLLEAMSCGVPTIGAKVNGIRDIIDDGVTGILCKTDHGSIRTAILKLAKNIKLRQNISVGARKKIISEYDLNYLLRKEVDGIKSIC